VQRNQFGVDAASAVIEKPGDSVGKSAADAKPMTETAALLSAARACIGGLEASATGADLSTIGGPYTWEDSLLAASRAASVDAQGAAFACPADRPVRPDGGEVAELAASSAVSLA
jgi:hypothetical protein